LALAENSGLDPIGTLTEIKAKQVAENNPALGVNCFEPGNHGNLMISILLPVSKVLMMNNLISVNPLTKIH
jgi:chaperonin GroEL (HSP60 family)